MGVGKRRGCCDENIPSAEPLTAVPSSQRQLLPQISACNMLILMFNTLFFNAGCSREASHPGSTEHQGKIYSLFP